MLLIGAKTEQLQNDTAWKEIVGASLCYLWCTCHGHQAAVSDMNIHETSQPLSKLQLELWLRGTLPAVCHGSPSVCISHDVFRIKIADLKKKKRITQRVNTVCALETLNQQNKRIFIDLLILFFFKATTKPLWSHLGSFYSAAKINSSRQRTTAV